MSVQFETYKGTRGKEMKSDTYSQERKCSVISDSTVEFMTPPPPQKKIDEYLPALLDILYAQLIST